MRVDYFAIEEAIQAQLQAAAALAGVAVAVEEELPFTAEAADQVEIYLERREAPAELQRLAAGTQTRFQLRFSLWCYAKSMASIAAACHRRDDLIGKVEVALMEDRTLGATVTSSWLEGGAFETQREPTNDSGWFSGGEIILVADVRATT